jgi:hypothetical protein
MVAVVRDRIRVVELIRRVVARLRRQLGGPLDHVADVLGRDVRRALDRLDDVELGAERANELEALLREAVGHDDQAAVPLRTAHEREGRSRAASRVLDDRASRRQRAVLLGTLDHRERHPVLHRSGWISVLELHPHLGAAGRRAAGEPHERRVANRVEDR